MNDAARFDAARDAAFDAALAHIVARFEALGAADVARLGEVYADDARFRDPFNDVRGLAAIQRVYAHMFDALDAPRFVVRSTTRQQRRAFVAWNFVYARRAGAPLRTIAGGSLLTLDDDGRIVDHTDHWDASELALDAPLLGALVRWLKRRARA